jgi:hypothetical protein
VVEGCDDNEGDGEIIVMGVVSTAGIAIFAVFIGGGNSTRIKNGGK